MDFTAAIADVKKDRLAGRRYEKEGHGKFRDCVTVCRNGKILFERFNYGEAASLMFDLWDKGVEADGTVHWKGSNASYVRVEEAPQKLTGYENGALLFDGSEKRWLVARDYATFPKGGLGTLPMLVLRWFR